MRSITTGLLALAFVWSLTYQVNGQRRSTAARPPSLNEEAQQQANNYWSKRFAKCGDSYFTWEDFNGLGSYQLWEAKDPKIEITGSAPPPPRTRADRMNQAENPSTLQWSGRSLFRVAVRRVMSPRDRVWSQWGNEFAYFVDIEKRGGVWHIDPPKEISCKDVDAFTLKPGANPPKAPFYNKEGVFIFPANYPGWFSLGKGPLVLRKPLYPSGSVYTDRNTCEVLLHVNLCSRNGARADALAPGFMWGVLIAKIGASGKPFMPFTDIMNDDFGFDTDDEVFIGINDSDYSDNRGFFDLVIRKGTAEAKRKSSANSKFGFTEVYVERLRTAKDDNGRPGQFTTRFVPGDRTIHAVIELNTVKAGTNVKIVWTAVNTTGGKDQEFKTIEYTTRREENRVNGHVTLDHAWPKGTYKVEVYVNGASDKTITYTIE